LGLLGLWLSDTAFFQSRGIGVLTLAILIGMLVGNAAPHQTATYCKVGTDFSRQWLLRLGIVLYGFRLTLSDIATVGTAGLLMDVIVLSSTFGLAWLLGTRVFKLERGTVLLIGAGSSICGAAAVMATDPVVRARSDQVAIAVATVLLFGTLATFVYPLLFQLNQHWHWIPVSDQAFGIYTGSTVHEVAQVVAAANSVSLEATHSAVIAKMLRVIMLAPFLMLLSFFLARRERQSEPSSAFSVPWFAVLFFLVMLLNSFVSLPVVVLKTLQWADGLVLATAMSALGMSTRFSAIRQGGFKPLLLAGLLFLWLVVGGATLSHFLLEDA
jgi:uncharacterized integral membrane protein (TIGR00698 family)